MKIEQFMNLPQSFVNHSTKDDEYDLDVQGINFTSPTSPVGGQTPTYTGCSGCSCVCSQTCQSVCGC